MEAAADVLGDALHGSLIDAGERLAVACGGAWRGEGPAGGVRSAAEEVIALDRLLRRFEAPRTAWDPGTPESDASRVRGVWGEGIRKPE